MKPDAAETVVQLEALARVVIADVHRTTPLRMAFSPAPWYADTDDDSGDVYGVIHLVDHPPVRDPLGIHGIGPNPTQATVTQAIFEWGGFLDYNFELTLACVADLAASVVQVGLWSLGLDPAWPACAQHSGRHPLRPVAGPLTDDPLTDRRTVPPMSVTWRCYQEVVRDPSPRSPYTGFSKNGVQYRDTYGPTAIPVGRLTICDGLATFAAE